MLALPMQMDLASEALTAAFSTAASALLHSFLEADSGSESPESFALSPSPSPGEDAVHVARLVVAAVECSEAGDRNFAAALDLLRDHAVSGSKIASTTRLHVGRAAAWSDAAGHPAFPPCSYKLRLRHCGKWAGTCPLSNTQSENATSVPAEHKLPFIYSAATLNIGASA